MDVSELFGASLSLIEHVARRVCRRGGVEGADADDFVSAAKLALMENDYAILRKFEERSSLSTFLTVVFHRLLADQRVREHGRWNASRAAQRMGTAGVLLEMLLVRDRRPFEEVLSLVQAADASLARADVEAMALQLPERAPRGHEMAMREDRPGPASVEEADAEVRAGEARILSGRVSGIMREALGTLSLEDRMLIRFRYGLDMSIADISRIMHLPQRPLYRRLEALLQRLRTTLLGTGVEAASILEIIGTAASDLDFGLGEPGATAATDAP